MYYFVEIACVISELLMIHMYLSSFSPSKRRSRWMVLTMYALCGAGVTVLSFVPDASFIRLAYSLAFVCALGRTLYNSKLLHSFTYSFIFFVLVIATDILTSLLLNALQLDSAQFMHPGPARMVYLITEHIVLFGVVVLVQLVNRKSPTQLSLRVFLPVLPVWLVSALLCYLLAWQILIYDVALPSLYILVLLGLLYTNLIIIYCTSTLQRQAEEKMERALAEHHYAMQQEYYDQFRTQQEETRALWHDISKYIRAFQTEDKSGETLKQLQSAIQSISNVVDVDNRVVSIILNEYVTIAKDMGIDLSMDVQVPHELPITAIDLYILLGNTLDNAINAVERLPAEQRRIDLQLKLHNQVLFYRITNPVSSDVNGNKQRLKKKYHGYGLNNVRGCVSKYGGEVNAVMEDHTFTVTAHLNCVNCE